MDLNLPPFLIWMSQVTQPNHRYYHPVQTTIFATITYISTTYLTSLSFISAAPFFISTYAISQFISPLFIECLQPYQNLPLSPIIGQVVQLTLSIILAKICCNLLGFPLSLKEIRQAMTAFLITLFACRFILITLRQQLDFQ